VIGGLAPEDPGRIGPYRLVARLGRGGMGHVYLGLSAGGRPVAVKVIRADLAADPEFRVRFAREVAAVRQVSGLFTALVLDADVDSAVPWLATAYVAGPSLAEAVTGDGPMAARPALGLAAGLAESLCAIHAAGVVHCDLKPSNVLLSPDGPRVIDFGISRAAGPEKSTVSAAGVGWVTGSPGFMSPEQALGGEIGPPSDIFSLGAVLTFATTGRGPFGRGSRPELAYRLVYGPPDLGEIPAGLRPLVERCLAKDPAQRPTAGEVLEAANDGQPAPGWLPGPALGALAESTLAEGVLARAGAAEAPRRPSGRRWWRPLAAAGVTSGMLAASVAVSFALGAVGPRSPATELAPRAVASPTLTTALPAPAVPGTRPASAPPVSSPARGPRAAIVPAVVAAGTPRPSRPPPSTTSSTTSATASPPPASSPPASPSASPSMTVSPSPTASSSPSPGESPSPTPAPEITGSATYREGTLVYFDVQYQDPGNDVRGFGFMGVNGSRWMEATYPFSSPDEGIAGPDSISYPLDLECGTASQHGAEVEAWIYDAAGQSSQPVRISLACPS
jgi:eukaryotic-like serine/threonine-protein kinase